MSITNSLHKVFYGPFQAVNETKKTEEEQNQIRLTTRRDDSGIYEEIDDAIKKVDC